MGNDMWSYAKPDTNALILSSPNFQLVWSIVSVYGPSRGVRDLRYSATTSKSSTSCAMKRWMRWSGRQSSLGGVPITGICLVRYGKPRPCRTKSIAETGSVRETPGLPYRTFTPPDFHAREGSAQKTHVFLCRTCCIGVGLPVLLPRRADFPRRSVRRGGILRDKLRETPVSHCATIRVLFLMLVLSAEE